MSNTPRGIVAIFTNQDGRVIASVNDFAQDRPGGFSVREAQQSRAKYQLARAVADAYCSSEFTKAMEDYDCQKVMNALCSRHGCKASYVCVGAEDAA